MRLFILTLLFVFMIINNNLIECKSNKSSNDKKKRELFILLDFHIDYSVRQLHYIFNPKIRGYNKITFNEYMLNYYTAVVNSVNYIYKNSFEHEFEFLFAINTISLYKNVNLNWTTSIEPHWILKSFTSFLENRGRYKNSTQTPTTILPILLKGRTKESNFTGGYTYVGAICHFETSYHAMLVTETMTELTANFIAHEIGHQLGLNHNNESICEGESIMNAMISNAKILFSKCSKSEFYDLMKNRARYKCISSSIKSYKWKPSKIQYIGSSLSIDDQCEREIENINIMGFPIQNPSSCTAFGRLNVTSCDLMCPFNCEYDCTNCWHLPGLKAYDGTKCGKNQICLGGKCM